VSSLAQVIVAEAASRATAANPNPVTGLTLIPFQQLAQQLGSAEITAAWTARWPNRALLNCHGCPVLLARQYRKGAHD
jgi:hypothetical protein